jgi:hypothetical protein
MFFKSEIRYIGIRLIDNLLYSVRALPAHRTAQTQNKCTQASLPQVGFEPTIPVFEWAKTFHALDRAATVISLGGT